MIKQKHLDDIVLRIGESSSEEMRSQVNDWVADMRYKQARVLIGALPEYGERLATRLERSIDIRVEGADTRMGPEIMRSVMHSLIQLVRNPIDHGLETSIEREEMHKPTRGTIIVSCAADAEGWDVGFTDDGRGINLSKVVQKALKNGHITEEKLSRMSREEKLGLIFLSGLSTSKTSRTSPGRGVGMHAVQQAVESAGGHLAISSDEGRGTSIRVRIPKSA